MCVCVCMHTHAHMHSCVSTFVHALCIGHMYVHVRLYMCVGTMCMHRSIYCVCTHIYMCVYTHVCMCSVCSRPYVHIYPQFSAAQLVPGYYKSWPGHSSLLFPPALYSERVCLRLLAVGYISLLSSRREKLFMFLKKFYGVGGKIWLPAEH